MKILGLTGGIGMGKTTVARMLKQAGFPVFDSDAEVHRLQGPGGEAVQAVGHLIPSALIPGTDPGLRKHPSGASLSRTALRQAIMADPSLIRSLEKILHPMVFAARDRFLRRCRYRGVHWAVIDVPLLFETGTDRRCNRVAVVSAPHATQVRRIAQRRSMSRTEAARMIALQMPDCEKRRRADVVIRTGLSMADTRAQVRALIRQLRSDNTREKETQL
ncbi:dephospho-CoA kinase [Acetobacter oeni]|uniref:Dephospho-CoA kinase n=1 Tax=Acetobacter oeni TaxID=304077 RepID=A0A511XKK5_9PROT|nr:dephospho-CoA kinase [Acetobacter oeni]MBB3881329.1 dephospho-CoA kinase [Acetobacter oeni]NHO18201.1 dephospho-CoA kinase [Acetobacter oeni]GBR11330.1 dephospho-CoA kinase [Acetobacter oeni LMG 21952]GEN63477.1 dephospho-CoA kinase [Acetobacter oeni]